ncbi:MAG: hypothetical protein ACOYNO_04415 [Saprospiraceae bacterium]
MFQQPMQYGPGTGTFIDHSLEIFFMLAGAFLIGLWLGWLIWSRYQKQFEKYRQENESHAATALTLRTQVEELNARISAAESDRAGLNAQVNSSNWENTELRQKLDAALAESEKSSAKVRQLETELALGKIGRPEEQPFQFNLPIEIEDKPDLPLPAVPEWEISVPAPSEWALPVMPPMPAPPKTEQITEIAVDNGAVALDLSIFDIPAFHPAPPFVEDQASDATPIPQPPGLIPDDDEPDMEHFEAEMQPVSADRGLHDVSAKGLGLPPLDIPDYIPTNDLTDTLHAAKGVVDMLEHFESPVLPEPEPLILPLRDVQAEDLKIVEGIGPKIEALLMKNGIRNYQELAAAPVDRLREILSQAGPQYALHDPGTWSAQALLAANGEWENLKAYQEFLDAGKRPK